MTRSQRKERNRQSRRPAPGAAGPAEYLMDDWRADMDAAWDRSEDRGRQGYDDDDDFFDNVTGLFIIQ